MKNVFCTECGTKHPIASSMPRFCSSCGNSMSGGQPAQSANREVASASETVEYEEGEVPKLKKIKVQIDVGERETIQSIASTGMSLDEVDYNHGKAKGYRKKSKKAIIEDTMKACAPVVKSKSIDES